MKCNKCGNVHPGGIVFVFSEKNRVYGAYCSKCKNKDGDPLWIKWVSKEEEPRFQLPVHKETTYLDWLKHEESDVKVAAFIYDIVAKYGTKDREVSITTIKRKLAESIHHKTVPPAPATPAPVAAKAPAMSAKAPAMPKEEERLNSSYETIEIEEHNNKKPLPWEDGCEEEEKVTV